MKKTVLCILATVTVMLALCMPVFAQGYPRADGRDDVEAGWYA